MKINIQIEKIVYTYKLTLECPWVNKYAVNKTKTNCPARITKRYPVSLNIYQRVTNLCSMQGVCISIPPYNELILLSKYLFSIVFLWLFYHLFHYLLCTVHVLVINTICIGFHNLYNQSSSTHVPVFSLLLTPAWFFFKMQTAHSHT